MKGRRYALALVGALVVLGPMTGAAEEEVLEWEGTLERPHKKVKNVEFVVTRAGARTSGIAMRHEGTLYEFKNVVDESGRITFSWTPGNAGDIECVMILQDNGTYKGSCPLAESDDELGMTMLPKRTAE